MPNFVLNRTCALQGHGHSINFIKGEPCWVPIALVKDAIGIGAECVDDEKLDAFGSDKAPEPELTNEERETLLVAAFDQILARNGDPAYRDDFTAQGVPNIKALAQIVGFTPTSKERNEGWQKHREDQAS